MTGKVDRDGTVTIWAITSTISANGDQGADPNKLVRVTDRLSATTVPASNGEGDHCLGKFETIYAPRAGEVLRGVAFAPSEGW